ncbi:histidine phosphatase family protein [Hyphomonas johnsonii]|uniref:Phosphoglycerate mutase n=1 Tax=Hyphomonas johnsonii MHS-2 TaxID=1280950 RepID=A0A059FVA1_9PROT|nr:histidine phosphatase family protein [Hyphomonas johnsonii]KCZ94589.1 phosphoglycerate mutase [Hyphomonas johnsonii MHS-2]
MIFLVRHGEAAAGWGDHPDPGLSDLGQKQASAVAGELARLGATQAVTSPMQRCRETARPFEQAQQVVATVSPAVSEIVTPEGVGDRVTWLRNLMAGTWDAGADDFTAWRSTMVDFIGGLPDNTVVFSHFVAINAIAGMVAQDPRVVIFRPGHCSVTRLERRNNVLSVAEYGSESATRVL